ncbi:MAG: hypothetical protein P8Y69_16150 [Gammaproteobacteria bacterium]
MELLVLDGPPAFSRFALEKLLVDAPDSVTVRDGASPLARDD